MRNEMIDLIRYLKKLGYLKDPRIEAAMMELDRADFALPKCATGHMRT